MNNPIISQNKNYCDYCTPNTTNLYAKKALRKDSFFDAKLDTQHKAITVTTYGFTHLQAPIKKQSQNDIVIHYCPMCGRSL